MWRALRCAIDLESRTRSWPSVGYLACYARLFLFLFLLCENGFLECRLCGRREAEKSREGRREENVR